MRVNQNHKFIVIFITICIPFVSYKRIFPSCFIQANPYFMIVLFCFCWFNIVLMDEVILHLFNYWVHEALPSWLVIEDSQASYLTNSLWVSLLILEQNGFCCLSRHKAAKPIKKIIYFTVKIYGNLKVSVYLIVQSNC